VGTLAALALIGALALACFAKAAGAVFLGEPRTPAAAAAVEAPASMRAAMGILAGACALLGLAPVLLARPLDRVLAELAGAGPALPRVADLASLLPLSLLALAAAGLGAGLWRWSRGSRPGGRVPTWDCGYAAPTARMQYTASSFAEGLLRWLGWLLRPEIRKPRIKGLFPGASSLHTRFPDLVLERGLEPGLDGASRLLGGFRFLQAGHLPVYLLYVLLTLLALLLWMVV
jgi:hydrogenase-4 component B